ncbi:MAG: helix-turn-helix domain-containing protein [Candidatus Berkelbacteria bacterium]
MSDLLSTKEAGEILGVSIRTIQRYIKTDQIKAKEVNGKSLIKKDVIYKLKGVDPVEEEARVKAVEQTAKQNAKPASYIPDGYIMIDKETLDSLRGQITTLTSSVGDMQSTQKLLIEKGLNLKEELNNQARISAPTEDVVTINHIAPIQVEEKVPERPIEELAKVHEDFFGKKESNKSLTTVIVVLVFLVVVIATVLFLNNAAK